jgi:hypothetical protein
MESSQGPIGIALVPINVVRAKGVVVAIEH